MQNLICSKDFIKGASIQKVGLISGYPHGLIVNRNFMSTKKATVSTQVLGGKT